MIEVIDVHKSFGHVAAVRGVSFALEPGQVAGLLGPNGAGKTTTIRMIAGFFSPDQGSVRIQGYDTLDQPILARIRLGYLPEAAPLYQDMNVQDYLDYRGRLFQMDRQTRRTSLERVLERCWLREMRKRRISKLSKGYKQRVGLAAALLHNPPALLLDEPTNGLDPAQMRETRQLIRELSVDRTMLISTHILSEVEKLCDRALIVAGGRLLADGSPSGLVARAQESATYIVQVQRTRPGDDARVFKIWQALPYIVSVEPNTPDRSSLLTGWSLWMLTARPGAPDLREQIAGAAQAAGLLVRELKREAATLERVFLSLVESASAATTDPDSTHAAHASATTPAAAPQPTVGQRAPAQNEEPSS
jgi:ABC-2 type transport system ATP-binding protein